MNTKEFKKIVGRKPEQDDLERVNCDKIGEPGHYYCGVCPKCKFPKFMCQCKSR